MKGLPFNAEMALAVWEGRKSVTRRPMKDQPDTSHWKQEAIDTPKEWRKQAYLGPQHMSHDPNMWCLFNVGDSYGAVPYTGRKAPYSPGEVVYMQEPFVRYQPIIGIKKTDGRYYEEICDGEVAYKADGFDTIGDLKDHMRLVGGYEIVTEFDDWRSPITMPQRASRLHLKLTVRPERLWCCDNPHDEILKEGWPFMGIDTGIPYKDFSILWDSIYCKKYPSSSNPYIWRYGLEEVWRR